nr:hypothetical protein [Tanacetum cinerariifolium]
TLHEDFKKCTYFELVVYRRRLLHYLDERKKLLKEGTLKDGELQLKEKAVKAIKEIEKWLKEKEKQTEESMVIGTLLVSQGAMICKFFQAHTRTKIRQFRDTLIQHMESVKKSIDE